MKEGLASEDCDVSAVYAPEGVSTETVRLTTVNVPCSLVETGDDTRRLSAVAVAETQVSDKQQTTYVAIAAADIAAPPVPLADQSRPADDCAAAAIPLGDRRKQEAKPELQTIQSLVSGAVAVLWTCP